MREEFDRKHIVNLRELRKVIFDQAEMLQKCLRQNNQNLNTVNDRPVDKLKTKDSKDIENNRKDLMCPTKASMCGSMGSKIYWRIEIYHGK